VANGFQKEEAPAPAPDQAWQPEMRIRAKAMTETRHAVEYLNPRVHLEVNAANRTNATDRPAVEMGREGEQVRDVGERKETDIEFNRRVAAYEQLLKALWERINITGEMRSTRERTARAEAERGRGPVQHHNVPSEKLKGNKSSTDWGKMTATEDVQLTPPASYYFRRGAQAYGRIQEETQIYQTNNIVSYAI
jgi:hypothetical protein